MRPPTPPKMVGAVVGARVVEMVEGFEGVKGVKGFEGFRAVDPPQLPQPD